MEILLQHTWICDIPLQESSIDGEDSGTNDEADHPEEHGENKADKMNDGLSGYLRIIEFYIVKIIILHLLRCFSPFTFFR